MAVPQYLIDRMNESVVRKHSRGIRRYFPIKGNKTDEGFDEDAYTEAFFILYGEEPKDNFDLGMAILHGLTRYIEQFEDSFQLWVRTIVAIDNE